MTIVALTALYDLLPIKTCKFSIQRFDQVDELGNGDSWQAELSRPRWKADVTLDAGKHQEIKQAAALVRKLDGARQAFLMCDPTSLYPYSDPKGLILGASKITLRELGTDLVTARMKGFPAGYALTIGDKLQITYNDGRQHAFVEVGATVSASGIGYLDVPVFPRLPVLAAAGNIVTLIRPSCPVVIVKDSFDPGTSRQAFTEGTTFSVIQKTRV